MNIVTMFGLCLVVAASWHLVTLGELDVQVLWIHHIWQKTKFFQRKKKHPYNRLMTVIRIEIKLRTCY